jgi:hypothetical protein
MHAQPRMPSRTNRARVEVLIWAWSDKHYEKRAKRLFNNITLRIRLSCGCSNKSPKRNHTYRMPGSNERYSNKCERRPNNGRFTAARAWICRQGVHHKPLESDRADPFPYSFPAARKLSSPR